MKNEDKVPKAENPVAKLRERFRRIQNNRKPSKERVEETFVPSKSNQAEQPKPKKIAHAPD